MSGERKIVAQEVDPAAAIVVAAGKGDINALKFLRTLGSSLAAAGSEFKVNTVTTGDQSDASIAINRFTGDFIVTWTSAAQDGSGRIQRFNQITFEMIDLESGVIVWSNLYDFARVAADSVMYR